MRSAFHVPGFKVLGVSEFLSFLPGLQLCRHPLQGGEVCGTRRKGQPQSHQCHRRSKFLWLNEVTFGLLVTLSQPSGRVFYHGLVEFPVNK